MRKASRTFGLNAGIFTLVFSIFLILNSIYLINDSLQDKSSLQDFAFTLGIIRVVILNLLTVAAGILGIIAAQIVKKRNTGAGIMMIIGAALCLLSIVILFNILFVISIVLFIFGSIFALKRERPVEYSQQPAVPNPPQSVSKRVNYLASSEVHPRC